jgi:Transposase, Mutator family
MQVCTVVAGKTASIAFGKPFSPSVLKVRDGGSVQRKACYLALAITMDGEREVLGMWFQDTEGAKFWMQVSAHRMSGRPQFNDVITTALHL